MHTSLPQLELMFPEHALYAMNYRSYGGSGGSPSEKNLFNDALLLYDHVKDSHHSINTMGRSLGTGIAVYLATQRKIHKLALVTPYDSIAKVASKTYPVYPIHWLLRDHYNSMERAPQLTSQTLILIAENDQVVPPAHAHQLSTAVPAPLLTSYAIPVVGHNSIAGSEEYFQYLQHFFRLQY